MKTFARFAGGFVLLALWGLMALLWLVAQDLDWNAFARTLIALALFVLPVTVYELLF